MKEEHKSSLAYYWNFELFNSNSLDPPSFERTNDLTEEKLKAVMYDQNWSPNFSREIFYQQKYLHRLV